LESKSSMKHLIVTLIVFSLTSCTIRATPHFQERDRRLINLQREKDKLKRVLDPVDRTKTQIKISDILLTLTSEAVKTGDTEVMEQHLKDYLFAVKDAHETMVKTGRDAHKKPNGFKNLEIALRKQVNQLKDISASLSFDERQPVEKTTDEVTRIRDELLKALFGSQNVSPS